MNLEKEEFLFKTYPNLFPGGRNVDMRESLMRFGFPGDGWFDIINDLCKKLTETGYHMKVVQVKEKFGTLRFYVDIESNEKEVVDKIHDLIGDAEILTEKTCEMCGAPAKLRTGGWWRTTCDKCEEEREAKRKDQKW